MDRQLQQCDLMILLVSIYSFFRSI